VPIEFACAFAEFAPATAATTAALPETRQGSIVNPAKSFATALATGVHEGGLLASRVR
jgi:hypothetical protein